MKAKVIKKYNNIPEGAEGEFTQDDSWQGAYVGRSKPYGYFSFENNSGGITNISVKLAKETDNFTIIKTDEGE